MFVFKKYDRQNHVVILAMYFFILDKNNERPDWMTDLKHADSAW